LKKILIILCSLFLVGCQNYRELNNTAIVSAIGIDTDDNGYKVSVQIVNTEKNSNEQENLNNPIVYSSNGKNISDALNNINLKSPNILYLGHLQVVLISEKIAKMGINDFTDYFLRNNEINKNFTILISKDNTPEEVLNVPTSLVNFPRGNILGSIEVSSTLSGASNNIKFTNFINDLKSKGINPVMSSIKIVESEEKNKKNLQISDMAIFNKDKLVGYINKDEIIGYNFITNNIDNTIINIKCNKNRNMSIKLKNINTKTTFKLKNNNPNIIINVNSKANIEETNCDLDLKNIKEKTESEIKYLINTTINKIKQNYHIDIFGFGNKIYQKNPNYFKSIENNWNEIFSNLDIVINVNTDIETKGNLILKGWWFFEKYKD